MTDCFKAYDIRGRVPEQLDESMAYGIGQAYSRVVKPRRVAVGRDVRLSSPALCRALTDGFQDAGVDVLDIGLCGTEEIYFTVFHRGLDGGVMVTASHNPMDYNGMKLVGQDARPIGGENGLQEIKSLLQKRGPRKTGDRGQYVFNDSKQAYRDYLLQQVDVASMKPLKIVVNAGNGGAGLVIDQLESYLPFDFVKVHHQPDGHFPHGVPNPLLPECRDDTALAVRCHNADLGIAWDGDFDRCFFFDEQGEFVEGYYLVALLAEMLLARFPGEKIVHDPRLTWNTIRRVQEAGGVPVLCKTGHAFIKDRMRQENALYGGEMSAHHYFRDFHYCDSGMLPWLLVCASMSLSGKKLSTLVGQAEADFPCSGELNFRVADAGKVMERINNHFISLKPVLDHTDGLTMEFDEWRFNVRCSNTEPLLRLNVETHRDAVLLDQRVNELKQLIVEK